MPSFVPHGEKVLADSGMETPVWVCPDCNEYVQRTVGDPAPLCQTWVGEEADDNQACGTVMARGILVSRVTVYEATEV